MKIVIKVGGALVAKGVENLIKDLGTLVNQHKIVLVHGGGPQITELGKKIGKEAKYFMTPKGMKTRYTDKDQIKNVKMALAGLVNKDLVEACQMNGINAFGFTGLDGRTIVAERKEKIMVINERGKRQILRGEYSGKVDSVNPSIVEWLLENNFVPIIGSMSSSKKGEALNVDGDRAAIAVAAAIHADKYISLTDVPGIYKDLESKELIEKLNEIEAEKLMETLEGGMKKKVYAALEAIKKGIREVIIYSGEVESPITDILEKGKGTIIYKV